MYQIQIYISYKVSGADFPNIPSFKGSLPAERIFAKTKWGIFSSASLVDFLVK